jgi:hypothetical protein
MLWVMIKTKIQKSKLILHTGNSNFSITAYQARNWIRMHLIMLEMISLPEQYTVVYLSNQDLKANTFNLLWVMIKTKIQKSKLILHTYFSE